MPSRHRFLEPIHNVKEGFRPASAPPKPREYLVFIPGKLVSAPLAAAPSAAAKLRLVARSAALAVLAAGAIQLTLKSSPRLRIGGAYRDRTDDLKLAKLALSQLS
jgi:hypothetical protein